VRGMSRRDQGLTPEELEQAVHHALLAFSNEQLVRELERRYEHNHPRYARWKLRPSELALAALDMTGVIRSKTHELLKAEMKLLKLTKKDMLQQAAIAEAQAEVGGDIIELVKQRDNEMPAWDGLLAALKERQTTISRIVERYRLPARARTDELASTEEAEGSVH